MATACASSSASGCRSGRWQRLQRWLRGGRMCRWPFESVITGASSRRTSCRSWVANTTVVPSLLSSTKRRRRRIAISLSTFPVGSSAMRTSGWATTARAIATLLLASGQGGRLSLHLVTQSDPGQQFRDILGIVRTLASGDLRGRATLSNTVRWLSRRNSWNTTPTRRRICGSSSRSARPHHVEIGNRAARGLGSEINQLEQRSLPPDGPVRN